MGCCDQPGLMPFEEGLQNILATVQPRAGVEMVAIAQANGRVLAEAPLAKCNLPAFDNSAMDGYAVRYQDLASHKQLKLVGESYAGHPFTGTVAEGECIRIFTGAPMADSVDTVIMQEDVQREGDSIVINELPKKKAQHVRFEAEDIKLGAKLLAPGTQLNARSIALLSAAGIAELSVVPVVKVALFSTGDELVLPGQDLLEGQIYDSNRLMLSAELNQSWVQLKDYGVVNDKLEDIQALLQQAANECDVIVTSGGVSVGDADYVKTAVENLGQIDFWKLAIKPGKPFAKGKIGQCEFVGLPGNPVSAYVTAKVLLHPILKACAGIKVAELQTSTAVASKAFRKSAGRLDFQRAQVVSQVPLMVEPIGIQGSHILQGLAVADVLVVIEKDRGNVEAGETVQVMAL